MNYIFKKHMPIEEIHRQKKYIRGENVLQYHGNCQKHGMGWLPDYTDFRDYTFNTEKIDKKFKELGETKSIKMMLNKLNITQQKKINISPDVDLKKWCSPIENQESLGSCTAQAGVGQVEYFECRAFGKHIDGSRLFLYKVTRNLLHWTGDTGAFLRTTMGALRLFGIPPEEYWPYIIQDFDEEPTPFCYAYAQNFQAIQYYRLDPPNTKLSELLERIKVFLAAGLPSMFGFTVFSSINQADDDGLIPFPTLNEKILGGHAVMAVGYDDKIKIKNANGGPPTKGALLIRNSWGTGWGDNGYGWLPYEFVLFELAKDWWSLIKNEWVDTGKFGL